MVTVTWMIWPLVTATGVTLASLSGPYQGSGVVWVTQKAGLLVSRLLGLAWC